MKCEICKTEDIVPHRDYRLVSGWERIQRSAGGTNGIRVPDHSAQRFACMYCVDRMAKGLMGQQALLAD